MIVVRNVFHCKPGKASELIDRLKTMSGTLSGPANGRVLVDVVASFWTVVFELEAKTLDDYEAMSSQYSESEDARKAMEGYMELVDHGYREVFRIA